VLSPSRGLTRRCTSQPDLVSCPPPRCNPRPRPPAVDQLSSQPAGAPFWSNPQPKDSLSLHPAVIRALAPAPASWVLSRLGKSPCQCQCQCHHRCCHCYSAPPTKPSPRLPHAHCLPLLHPNPSTWPLQSPAIIQCHALLLRLHRTWPSTLRLVAPLLPFLTSTSPSAPMAACPQPPQPRLRARTASSRHPPSPTRLMHTAQNTRTTPHSTPLPRIAWPTR
jgi:hypothetical protein